MIDNILFFLSEAINGMRRSGLMIVISVITITVSLLIFGLVLLLSTNLNNLSQFMTSKLEIRVFLKDTITKRDRIQFQDRIRKMAKVDQVTFVSKDEAWVAFQKKYPSMKLDDLTDSNPLPHALYVHLQDHESLIRMAGYLKSFNEYVDEVIYGDKIAKQIQSLARVSYYAGFSLVVLLAFATLLIVMNTIRLTVIARQTEIEIMQLVGATNHFVRAPFLIEGVVIGVLGSVVAIAVLGPMYHYIVSVVSRSLPFFPLVVDSVILGSIYGFLLLVGVTLGSLGAYIGVSRSLRDTFS